MEPNNSLEKYSKQIAEVNRLPAKPSLELLKSLVSIFNVNGNPDNYYLELVIKIRDKDVNVKGLSVYLALIDRLYGRLSPNGLRSYVRRKRFQLKISEFRKGSLDLIIRLAYEHREIAALMLIVIFLKYLPNYIESVGEFIKTLSESSKNLADSYKSYEEGSLVRENRKRLKAEIEKEQALKTLTSDQKDELITIEETLFERESEKILICKDFANTYVEKVKLKVKKNLIFITNNLIIDIKNRIYFYAQSLVSS